MWCQQKIDLPGFQDISFVACVLTKSRLDKGPYKQLLLDRNSGGWIGPTLHKS